MEKKVLRVCIIFSFLLASCAAKLSPQNTSFIDSISKKPDYADLSYWAASPYKHDFSDSIPKPLIDEYRYDSTVDVFFIHPTTFTSSDRTEWNAALNDSAVNLKTDRGTILFQASAFNEFRLFAPRYRQAHLRSYYTSDTLRAKKAFDLAYTDVRNAFQYYLDHYNNNHPIIIASHSQGSTHAIRLLQEFFDDTPLQKKLVAAYVVGMRIVGTSFQSLPICEDSLQTGCICGWRSFKAGYEPAFVGNETGDDYVTNPLTWERNNEYAPRELNKGGVLKNFNRVYPHVAGARIHGRILWIRNLRFPGSFLVRMKNFHIADINLFYLNIRENLHARVNNYRKTNQ